MSSYGFGSSVYQLSVVYLWHTVQLLLFGQKLDCICYGHDHAYQAIMMLKTFLKNVKLVIGSFYTNWEKTLIPSFIKKLLGIYPQSSMARKWYNKNTKQFICINVAYAMSTFSHLLSIQVFTY